MARKHAARQSERGFTLIELLVVITVIAILTAVVTVSVGGFIDSANQKVRSTQFAAIQTAIDTYVSSNLDASGDLANAKYPYILANAGTAATKAFVTMDATAPATTLAFSETYSSGWYGSDGKTLSTQPQTTTNNVFIYVDLYSADAKTNLITAKFISTGSVKSPGTPATAAAVFRCIFISSVGPAAVTEGSTSEALAKTAVRSDSGKLLACRDADPQAK